MNLPPTPADLPAAPACPARSPRFIQLYQEDAASIRAELTAGLLCAEPVLSPKFLYDALGSTLFEAITRVPEYYPTRTEAAIFTQHLTDIAAAVGPIGSLIDLGAGNCEKASRLLPALQPRRYAAVDISVDFLADALARLQRSHPGLDVIGVGLDFSKSLDLPPAVFESAGAGGAGGDARRSRPVFFYPGSSIGNFTPEAALELLSGVRHQAAGGGLLIGVDLVKPAAILQPAYDDALGVTAAFNLNLLLHLNRLLGSDFDPRGWAHLARFDAAASRIQMHLQARQAVDVRWAGGERRFEAGERIHTENSYKYSVPGFAALLADAGFREQRHWLDGRGWFAVFWAAA